ncbi:hypothetical protein C8Q79DRAFT_538507 [Trametes meyenii]|nr:hypothetical protein C8Q79DRAFT_538507 [Trametes meyenii]
MRPVKTLPPKLRFLRWSEDNHGDADLPIFLSTLGSKLTEVDIEFLKTGDSLSDEDDTREIGRNGYERAITPSIFMPMKHAPNLCHLRLTTGRTCDDAADIIATLSSTIGAFRRLRFFICKTIPLNEAGVEALASLPDLSSCKILLQDNLVWPADKSPANTCRLLK